MIPKTRPASRGHRGFTLVELLVVITIIAVLASLLVVGATAAMSRARRARIKIEIDQMSQGMDQYKNEVSGGDYPPNAQINTDSGARMADLKGTPILQLRASVPSDLVRHMKRVSTRMRREEEAIVNCLAGGNSTFEIFEGTQSIGNILIGGMTPAEALVFYLNGFSDDPKFPITGSGGPAYDEAVGGPNGGAEGRTPVFEFEVARLGPRDSSGNFSGRWIRFTGPNGNPYRLNLWQYYAPSSNQPYVYFDTSRPVMDVEPMAGPHVHAIKQAATGATLANPIRYANEGKCQILHCGLDEKWGNFASMSIVDTPVNQLLLFPNGPFTLDLADTLTNFTTDTLEAAQP